VGHKPVNARFYPVASRINKETFRQETTMAGARRSLDLIQMSTTTYHRKPCRIIETIGAIVLQYSSSCFTIAAMANFHQFNRCLKNLQTDENDFIHIVMIGK
jgi:hypothetical protein